MDDFRIELLTKLFCQTLTEVVRRPAYQEALEQELTEVQVDCMRYIYLHHLPSIGEIAAGLGISNAAATKLVNRLVLKDWVERKEDPKDRRVLQMRLTETGERLMEQVRQRESLNLSTVLNRMDRDDQELLCRGLEGFLTAALKEKKWVDRVCLRCGWAHRTECPGNQIYRSMTGMEKDRV